MRILMLNYEFPPLGGGAANATYYLLKEFSKMKNIEIDLVTSSIDEYQEEQFSNNIKIYKLDIGKKEIHYWTQFEILRYSWKTYKLSKKLKKEKNYDLCHAWFGVPCGYIAKKLKLPYIVALRGSDVPGYNSRFSFQYIFLKPIIKSVWKNAGSVIANSEGLKNLALETMNIPIKVIYNGIDTKEFKPKFNKNKKLKILCVSRLIQRKGIEYLINAVKSLEVELTIIGKGKQESYLKSIAPKNVEFLGYIPHENIGKYYRNSDIFILPSLNEGMSNTILEAMASGLPIITTNTGGTKELIKGNGFVVSMRDSDAIKKAILKYIENPELIKTHGLKSREIAEKMSWENIAGEYYKVYRRMK